MKKDEVRVLFPSVVQFADAVREVFGDGVKLTYASENGRELGKRQPRDPERTVRISDIDFSSMQVDDARGKRGRR